MKDLRIIIIYLSGEMCKHSAVIDCTLVVIASHPIIGKTLKILVYWGAETMHSYSSLCIHLHDGSQDHNPVLERRDL